MMWLKRALVLSLVLGLQAGALAAKKSRKAKGATKMTEELKADIARLTPVELTGNVARLSEGDRKALDKIIEAARYMNPIFLRQVWVGNPALEKKLEETKTELGQLELEWFRINAGPWDRLNGNKAFIPGVPKVKPAGAGYYPLNMTRAEFESWVKTLSEPERKKATGFFWVIRRDKGGKLITVPYSEEYKEFLEPAAKLFREAADLTTNDTLKKYLKTRAAAFLSDDYYESDIAWMDLDSPLDITIGPYETYEDELFNYKAAFEGFVTLRDEAETAKLAKFSGHLQEIENHLPIEDKYKNPKLGAMSPIRVVDEVFDSGEAHRGVQTAAFNLPNDERVIKEKGSKRVMLRNVQEAKFNKVLIPIAKVTLDPDELSSVAFDPFFTHILMHELMHGLGPHAIKVNGTETTVREQLREIYSAIEEAKADITGLFAMQYLIDKGVLDKGLQTSMYTTFLASSFRSVRFGLNEAHGKGQALQFNYLQDQGAFVYNPAKGTFHVDQARVKEAVRKLTHDLLTIEAEGSYSGAKAMLDKYGVIRPDMEKALAKLGDVPIDIRPIFPIAEGTANAGQKAGASR